jgi:hypothetical protein
MKSVKSILIATTLICGSVVPGLSAQQAAQPAEQYEFRVALGDSVMIKRECVEYSTGEEPSVWVWDKVHTVRQLGTKKHPDGVLLMNIYSWICDTCLVPVNGHAEESAKKAAAEQKADREAFEAAQAAKKAAAANAAEETAQQAAAEAAAAQAAAEKAAADSIAAEEAARKAAAEQAKEDSVKSEQKFKHDYDRFTIGLRGGASALMHRAEEGKWTCGGDVVLDLQYAHYWAKNGRPVDLGIIVGLGIGYQQSGLNKPYDSTYFQRPSGAYNVNYTVVARDVKETDHQLQLEVPLMFSLIHENGLFFNVGPKFMIPVYTPYKQSVNQDGTHISAFFEETGVTVLDKEVTGVYKGQQPTEANGIQFKINVMLTAELGYEWVLKSGNSLGLGAYANYSVYNSFKNTPNSEGLFNLTAPTDTDKAHLDVLSATHAYTDKLGFFDAGVKVAYHFNFPKKMKYKASKLE